VLDLFIELDVNEDQIDFRPSTRRDRGLCDARPAVKTATCACCLTRSSNTCRRPKAIRRAAAVLITAFDYSDYVAASRSAASSTGPFGPAARRVLHRDGTRTDERIGELHVFDGLGRQKVDEVTAGDICASWGLRQRHREYAGYPDDPQPLPLIAIDEPTLHMTFRVNDSPFAAGGQVSDEPRGLGSTGAREAAQRRAARGAGHTPEEFHVEGRGLLHLSIWSRTCGANV